MAAYDMHGTAIIKRLARIEGRVRGISRMVSEDRSLDAQLTVFFSC